MKHLNLTIIALFLAIVSFASVGPISGPPHICVGLSGTYTDPTPGGTWTCASGILTISPTTGIATGVTAGTANITYTVGASDTFMSVTIDALPAPISGPSSVCVGSSITLTDPTPGGVWTTPSIAIVSISGTGVLTGISVGVATITYAGMSGCVSTTFVTVNPVPPAITGSTSVCAGGTTTFSDATPGGSWYSSNVTIATINTSGVATGLFLGTTTIGYSLGGCDATTSLTVLAVPSVYTVSGGGSYCSGGAGMPIYLSGSQLGVSYVLFNGTTPALAPVTGTGGPLSFGSFTGVGTYTVLANPGTSCATTMSGSATITINPLPTAYTVSGGGVVCSGGAGVHVTLSGSDIGVHYQLYLGGTAVGALITGTGGPLDWGTMTASGIYTVVATNIATYCTSNMSGSATITAGTLPTIYLLTGFGTYCAGGSGVPCGLSMSDIGINYSLYNGGTLVSTVPGAGSAISFGTISPAGSYTVIATNATTGCTSTTSAAVIAINPAPAAYALSSGGSYCTGGPGYIISLGGSSTGINYQLYSSGVAVGGPISGTGLALSFGYQPAGTYTIIATNAATGCSATMVGTTVVTMSATVVPSVSITTSTGSDTACAATLVSFTPVPVNGGLTPAYAWTVNGVASGSSSTYAYVPAMGDIVGVTLTSSALCAAPTTASNSITLYMDIPTVTASDTLAPCGGMVTMAATGATSFVWAPTTGLSCSACALTTLTPAATTTYTVTGTDGYGCTGTATITVSGNRITGHISYTGTPTDSFKVWLIQFNPSDSSIAAQDSMTSCMDAGVPYFQFDGKPAGDYLVKAKLYGTVPGTSGYIPTYSTSSAYWYSATSVTHAGAADDMPITMIYGTVPSGPGFIAGYVISGAGKGTSADVPAAGMMIYLKNASGSLITFTTTASDGTYSFANLAYGTYMIYPESYKDYTTPSATITLAPGSDSANAINFKQHTTTHTITPYDNSKVPQPVNTTVGINIFPNPASGTTTISWQNQSPCNATLVVTDMMGREVINTNLNINTPSGQAQLDLSALNDGMYIISIRSAGINFNRSLVKANN